MPWASIVTWWPPARPPFGTAWSAQFAPRPAAESNAGRVLEDVLDDGVEIYVTLDDAGFEPILEEVTAAGVAPVEPHGVDPVQPLHPAGELRLCRLDEQVKVVVEQIPRVDPPGKAPLDVEEELEPGLAVAIVVHNRA